MAEIIPVHRSMSGKVRPRLTTILLPNDLKATMTRVALDVFSDSVNGGTTFQDAILAVYLSGMDAGLKLNQEEEPDHDTA